MMTNPDFEPEFYLLQNTMMKSRYALVFKKWKLSWKHYYNYVSEKLRHNEYWIWIYLCGFEEFIQKNQYENKINRTKLYEESDRRIYKIIGDYYKVKNYVDGL